MDGPEELRKEIDELRRQLDGRTEQWRNVLRQLSEAEMKIDVLRSRQEVARPPAPPAPTG